MPSSTSSTDHLSVFLGLATRFVVPQLNWDPKNFVGRRVTSRVSVRPDHGADSSRSSSPDRTLKLQSEASRVPRPWAGGDEAWPGSTPDGLQDRPRTPCRSQSRITTKTSSQRQELRTTRGKQPTTERRRKTASNRVQRRNDSQPQPDPTEPTSELISTSSTFSLTQNSCLEPIR